MELFNLTAKLGLDTSSYERELERAKQKGKEFADHTDKEVKTKSVLAWTAIITAVVALTKKIVDLGKATIDYADNIQDMADKWGITTRQLQEFEYWATLNGTTMEAMLNAMTRLTNQAQVNASAFKELGISVKNENGELKDQKQLFLEVVNALNKVENQTRKNALQFDIFGRSGNEIAQVIKQGADNLQQLSDEAESLGIILSEKTIKSAGDFNDEMDRLRMQGRSAFAELIAGADGAEAKFDDFIANLEEKIEILAPIFAQLGQRLATEILKGIVKGLADRFWKVLQFSVGKGWLWDRDEKIFTNDWLFTPMGDTTTTASITNSVVNERTTTVNETLDISLSVESDGTVAGDKNLDTISDLMVEKINKALGDMVNG